MNWIFNFLFNFAVLQTVYGFFDVEELKTFNYGIDIRNDPVVMKSEIDQSDTSTIQLTSKYGQAYQCNFPNTVEQEKQKEEAEKIAIETGIPDLLKPMESGPCLRKNKDWWSYEFCYGKTIKQFHLGDDGTIEGKILLLGIYESEDEWENAEEQLDKERPEQKLKRYHTQQYVDGAKCDLNGKQRKTEVRFICEEGSADYIARVDEPETCSYIMTIHTMKICHHPYLKPPTPTRTVSITCNPLLTIVQYQEYLDQLEFKEQQKKEAEERKRQALEEKRRLEEEEKLRLSEEKAKYYEENQLLTDTEDGQIEVEGEYEMDTDVTTATDTEIADMLKTGVGKDGSPMKMKTVVKYVDDPDDLDKFLDEAMEEMKKMTSLDDSDDDDEETKDKPSKLKTPKIPPEVKPEYESFETLQRNAVKKYIEELKAEEGDDHDLEEFDSEIKTLKERYQNRRDKLFALKKKVKSSMEEQYAAIIKEAKDELREEGEETEVDEKEAVRQLTKTIDGLLMKLDKTEREIEAVDKELEQFAEYDPTGKGDRTPPVKQDDIPPAAEGPSKMNLDDRVKVRVSRMKPGQLKNTETTNKQTEALEKSVQKELEKTGLNGGNIQVKILTTGYYDKDDDTLHVLSEEESETFRNMIVTLIGGSVDADNEETRHSKMEENYSFVWGRDQAPSSSSLTSEDLDPDTTSTDTAYTTDTSTYSSAYTDENTESQSNTDTDKDIKS